MYWYLNKWFVGSVLIVVISGIAYFKGYHSGKNAVQTAWDKQVAESTLKSVEIERSMQKRVDAIVEEKNSEIARINRSHASVVARLQHRPERPAEVPASPAASQDCSGAGLYRQDAEFLAGEAARADLYAIELRSCYKAYEEVFNAANDNR